jgi:hypothetical protein
MSKGPGRVQRAILALIDADPDGAWTVEELCRRAYPSINHIDKRHLVVALRALRKMTLPGTWDVLRLRRQGQGYCLADPCSDEAQLRIIWLESGRCRRESFEVWIDRYDEDDQSWSARTRKRAREYAAEARRWRDATPVQKLDTRIAHLRTRLGYFGIGLQAAGDRAEAKVDIERIVAEITALEAKRDALKAAAA